MCEDEADRTRVHRREQGAQLVRGMFGQDFLDRTMGGIAQGEDALAEMARLALEQCYGDVWTRPGLSLRERSLVTLGLLIGTGHHGELRNHVLGASGNGLTRAELAEVALHAIPYVGMPAAGQAMMVVQDSCPTVDESDPASAVEVLRSVFAKADHTAGDAPDRHWHSDVVYYGMGADGIDREFHGKAALARLLSDARAVMDRMTDTLVAVHPAGADRAIAEIRAHRRAARTEESVEDTYVMVVQVADGLIVRGYDIPSAAYREFFQRQAAE